MSSRTPQRTVYLVTAAIVAAMVGGFALANMTIGTTNTSYQGSQTTTVSNVPGLTWLNTTLSEINVTAPGFIDCTVAGVCVVSTALGAATGFTVCAGDFPGLDCAAGDFIEQVVLAVSTATPFPASTVALTVFVTGTPFGLSEGTYAGPTTYFTELGTSPTPPSTPVNIVLDFDIGTTAHGPGGVASVSVIATT
jgi:hypothetical protein